jgi:hypothetical protein
MIKLYSFDNLNVKQCNSHGLPMSPKLPFIKPLVFFGPE